MASLMSDRQIPASRFKAECLAILDEVAATGETLVVTKRGRPVAKVAPTEPAPSLSGSVTFLVDDQELMAPIETDWYAAGR